VGASFPKPLPILAPYPEILLNTVETAELVDKAEAEKRAKDQQLNQQINAEAQAKAIRAQIVELVSLNKITERGDTEFRFDDNGKIKTLMLQNDTRELIVKGVLNIVCVNQQYNIVPRVVATNEYADYKIPDDLMW